MASFAEEVGLAPSAPVVAVEEVIAATVFETELVDAPLVMVALVFWLELESCPLTVELSSLFLGLLSEDLPEADGEIEFDADVWAAVIDGVVGPSRL